MTVTLSVNFNYNRGVLVQGIIIVILRNDLEFYCVIDL